MLEQYYNTHSEIWHRSHITIIQEWYNMCGFVLWGKYWCIKSISVTYYLRKWACESSTSSSVFETYVSLRWKCATATEDCTVGVSSLSSDELQQNAEAVPFVELHINTHHRKYHPKKSNLFRISIQQLVRSWKWITSAGHKCLCASWELEDGAHLSCH